MPVVCVVDNDFLLGDENYFPPTRMEPCLKRTILALLETFAWQVALQYELERRKWVSIKLISIELLFASSTQQRHGGKFGAIFAIKTSGQVVKIAIGENENIET